MMMGNNPSEIQYYTDFDLPFEFKSVSEFFNKKVSALKLNKYDNYIEYKKLNNGSVIKNSVLGENTEVGEGSLIRNSIIFSDVKIGFSCENTRSLLLPSSYITHHNFIGDSLICRNVTISGNTRTTNKRLDQNKVKILVGNTYQVLETSKAGIIIGDYSIIGSSVVTMPGTLIGRNVKIEPLQVINGFIENNTYVNKE